MTVYCLLFLGVRDYQGINGSVRNCTFDGNRYGVVVLSDGALEVLNCLFTGSAKDGDVGHGISYRDSGAILNESYNAFWGNDYDIYDYYEPEEIDINMAGGSIDLGSDPYDGGWDDFGDRFFLNQGGDCVVEGGEPASSVGSFYSTAAAKFADSGTVDIGYHYPVWSKNI